jgi:hypothetical protein
MMPIMARLANVGFEKTRRAVAALPLSFFVMLYLMVSFNAPEGWTAAFVALAGCYLVAFLAIVAEWFWARWFAAGIAWSGVMVGGFSLVMFGWSVPLAIYTGLHALVLALLTGNKMALLYDLQEPWRQRFQMDEFGVARLRKTVTRAAASLPGLILWALGPKNPEQTTTHLLFALAVGGLGVVGLHAVVRGRTWGLLALSSAAVALFVHAPLHARAAEFLGAVPFLSQPSFARALAGLPGAVMLLALSSSVVAVLLAASVAPFAGPMLRSLRPRRSHR